MSSSFTRTLRLKVRPESYGCLSAAAVEVNQIFNFCNEASRLAATRTGSKRKWFSGFDLCSLTAGAAQYFERIGADTIQRVCEEYAQKRTATTSGGGFAEPFMPPRPALSSAVGSGSGLLEKPGTWLPRAFGVRSTPRAPLPC